MWKDREFLTFNQVAEGSSPTGIRTSKRDYVLNLFDNNLNIYVQKNPDS